MSPYPADAHDSPQPHCERPVQDGLGNEESKSRSGRSCVTTNDSVRHTEETAGIGRRGLLGRATALAVGGAVLATGAGTAAAGTDGGGIPRTDSPLKLIPVPPQVPATAGYAPVPGAR